MATHVLATDDNAADRDLVRPSLLKASHCYKLECEQRLSEGFEKLGNQRADVVLLDLNLPDSQVHKTSPLPGFSTFPDAAPRSSTESATDGDHRPEVLVCVLKARRGYQGFVIEARVHERRDGGFSAEISIENHDPCGATAKQFYIPKIFEAPDPAMDCALQAGRQRIKEDLLT